MATAGRMTPWLLFLKKQRSYGASFKTSVMENPALIPSVNLQRKALQPERATAGRTPILRLFWSMSLIREICFVKKSLSKIPLPRSARKPRWASSVFHRKHPWSDYRQGNFRLCARRDSKKTCSGTSGKQEPEYLLLNRKNQMWAVREKLYAKRPKQPCQALQSWG